MSVTTLNGVTAENALRHIGQLIDFSCDLKKRAGLEHAIDLGKELRAKKPTKKQEAILDYFTANAWAGLRHLASADGRTSWDWQQKVMENELFHLRSAIQSDGFKSLHEVRRCQILTNLANLFDSIGRFIEALDYWGQALKINPSFGMARGNRGIALGSIARFLYDHGHSAFFLMRARDDIQAALLDEKNVHPEAAKGFKEYLAKIDAVLSRAVDRRASKLNSFSLGQSEDEVAYRKWCLKERLFLNPLNDLELCSVAARDVLMLPTIVTGVDEGPNHLGFYNQMKQEYVSARYLYYEGAHSKTAHFSDREVVLYNTLDFPCYSLAAEKTKVAFRTAYSLFDKVSYFLNNYLELGIPERDVNFKTFWYASRDKKKGLRSDFQRRANWPLRGLFWLSQDLYDDSPGFRGLVEPGAQKLYEIRQHLEHKYLKLHEHGTPDSSSDIKGLTDTLAMRIGRKDFEAKTLRLLKLVRSTLIYLSLGIHQEERSKNKARGLGKVVPIKLPNYDDEWKI
jgi:tetratricopeptide (TPR) repeat protein